MKQRNPAAVFFLSIITLGIYSIVWSVKTKNEMNRLGNNIPTAWLWIIPFVSYYWLWKYSEGVEKVTNGKISAITSFILLVLLSIVGMAILQNEFNKLATAPTNDIPAPVPGPNPPVTPPIGPTEPPVNVPPVITPTVGASTDSQPQPETPQFPPQPPKTPIVG